MRILIADDEPVSLRLLERTVTAWGYDVTVLRDGHAAWGMLSGPTPPPLAILDWMMPGLTGVEVCRRVRDSGSKAPSYLILLTGKSGSEDLVTALETGADDFVRKPFEPAELRARLGVGVRVVRLQQALADRVVALESALAQVTQLQGLLPICMYCKRIRQDGKYWQKVESYIAEHSSATFTHGVCPECIDKHVRPEIERARRDRGGVA